MIERPISEHGGRRWDLLALMLQGLQGTTTNAATGDVQDSLLESLPKRALDFNFWAEFVSLSSAHAVVPAFAPALVDGVLSSVIPEDLTDYVVSMEEANAKRNCHMAEGLYEIVARLNHVGVVPVIGKGGAFLAEAVAAEDLDRVRWRFLSDLDLYVSRGELFACLETLFQSGFVPASRLYDPDRMAHYPPLISPCETYSVEIHTRLFAHKGEFARLSDLRSEGNEIALGDARVQVPSRLHRLAHLVAHAQLHNRFYPLRRMFARDMADLRELARRYPDGEIDLAPLLLLFDDPQDQRAIAAFFALGDLIGLEDVRHRNANAMVEQGRKWARQVTSRYLMRPSLHRTLSAADVLAHEMKRTFLEPGGWRRFGQVAAAPWRFAEWVQNERRRSQSIR